MGKELKELCFAERENVIYMAKATGSPTLKVIPFDDESNETIYKGEGNIQLTAYWPYARDKKQNLVRKTITDTSVSASLANGGDLPTHIKITATDGNFSQVSLPDIIINGVEITSWDSKTGIAKNENGQLVSYSGDGLYQLPVGNTNITITGTAGTKITIEYYQQYY